MNEIIGVVFQILDFLLGMTSAVLAIVYIIFYSNNAPSREKSGLLRLTKMTGVVSILAPFFFCLLSDTYDLYDNMGDAAGLCALFMFVWMAVTAIALLAFIVSVLTGKNRKQEKANRKSVIPFAVLATLLSQIISWLFS